MKYVATGVLCYGKLGHKFECLQIYLRNSVAYRLAEGPGRYADMKRDIKKFVDELNKTYPKASEIIFRTWEAGLHETQFQFLRAGHTAATLLVPVYRIDNYVGSWKGGKQ